MPWAPRKHDPHPNRPPARALADKERDKLPHRRARQTQRYRRFRKALLAERPLCQRCLRVVSVDVHHVRGLAAHPEDLCDPAQTEALCKRCHGQATAQGE